MNIPLVPLELGGDPSLDTTTLDFYALDTFHNLAAVDVVEVLAQFDLRRDMLKTSTFKAIEPFTHV